MCSLKNLKINHVLQGIKSLNNTPCGNSQQYHSASVGFEWLVRMLRTV